MWATPWQAKDPPLVGCPIVVLVRLAPARSHHPLTALRLRVTGLLMRDHFTDADEVLRKDVLGTGMRQ